VEYKLNDIQQTRMLFEDQNLQKHPMLNNTEYWNKIKSQIRSKCTELRRKKRKGNNSQVKSTYSKKMTRPISSVKQSLENNFAHLEQIMNSTQLSLTPIDLINLLPKNDEALWYTYHDMEISSREEVPTTFYFASNEDYKGRCVNFLSWMHDRKWPKENLK